MYSKHTSTQALCAGQTLLISPHPHLNTHTHTHAHIHIHIYTWHIHSAHLGETGVRSRVKETLPPSSHVPRGTSGLRHLQLLTKTESVLPNQWTAGDYRAAVIQ